MALRPGMGSLPHWI